MRRKTDSVRQNSSNTMNTWLGIWGYLKKYGLRVKTKVLKKCCTFSVPSVQVSAMDHKDSKDRSKTF